MSYCRVGEHSDVYVVRTGKYLSCYHTAGTPTTVTESEQRMIDHLLAHRESGEQVPQRAIDRLIAERDHTPFRTDVQVALDTLTDDR